MEGIVHRIFSVSYECSITASSYPVLLYWFLFHVHISDIYLICCPVVGVWNWTVGTGMARNLLYITVSPWLAEYSLKVWWVTRIIFLFLIYLSFHDLNLFFFPFVLFVVILALRCHWGYCQVRISEQSISCGTQVRESEWERWSEREWEGVRCDDCFFCSWHFYVPIYYISGYASSLALLTWQAYFLFIILQIINPLPYTSL